MAKQHIHKYKSHRDFNSDQYPTDDELEIIRTWKENYKELMDYVCHIWHWSDMARKVGSNNWTFLTGGWSGNEEIIEALKQNILFWTFCWESSVRGGHYKFEVPENK